MHIQITDQLGKSPRRPGGRVQRKRAAALKLSANVRPNGAMSARRASPNLAGLSLNLGDQPECTSSILDALGLALLNRGCLEEGKRLIEAALSIRLSFFGENHPVTAASLMSHARVLRDEGDLQAAEGEIRRALLVNRKFYPVRSLPVAVNLRELGFIQLQQGRFSAAERSARRGLAILAALGLRSTDPNASRLLDTLGRALQGRSRFAEAATAFNKALALDAKQVGRKHPKYATHLANFGTLEESRRNLKEAERHYRAAIDVYENAINRRRHPNLIDIYGNLGALLAQGGRFAEARKYLRTALALNEQIRGSSHTFVGYDHANLGELKYRIAKSNSRKDLTGAAQEFATARTIYRKNVVSGKLPARHPYIAAALTWEGRMLIEGRPANPSKAELLLNEALRTWGREFRDDSVERAITSASLGRALFMQNKQLDRARELLTTSYPIVVRARGKDSDIAQLIKGWLDDLPDAGKPVGARAATRRSRVSGKNRRRTRMPAGGALPGGR